MPLGQVGSQAQRTLQRGDGLRVPAEHVVGDAEVVVRHGVVRLEPDGLLEGPRGLRVAPEPPVSLAQAVVSLVVVRLEADGLPELLDRLLQPPEPLQDPPQVAPRQTIIGGGKVSGVIYLTSFAGGPAFDERHLELVTAVAAIASGAVESVGHLESVEGERRRLHEELNLRHTMVGESERMQEVLRLIARVAPSDSSVLIRGESGTGKELVARALHANSPRADKPFVAINCAALTETLLESELFGHEKGAFTGAVALKKGKMEVADGGTLFLDEVGELSQTLQAKLLRVLQERTFERVGGTRQIKVDLRLVAATNKNLQEAVSSGTFREDLYYRLNVIGIDLPPLRERREDIPLLARYFAAKYGEKCKRRVNGVAPEACACLASHDWHGNVRELENAVERAVVLGTGDMIMPEDLPEPVRRVSASVPAPDRNFYEVLKDTKKQLVLNAIDQSRGNYAEAARLLGIHPNNLHRLVRNLDLRVRQAQTEE